jgi:glucose/arabinose dehydrogenase
MRRYGILKVLGLLLSAVLALGASNYAPAYTQAAPPESPAAAPLGLPPGFVAEVYATGLSTPRFLTFSPQGDLYVVEFGKADNAVKVLPDRDHDGKPDFVRVFASGLTAPNNVAFYGNSAYVGEPIRVLRFEDMDGDLRSDTRNTVVGGIPGDGRHRTRTVGFGPDNKLYVNVGSFNDDAPEAEGRATIWQYNLDGSGGRVFASGLRNTVGFDWDPVTGQMWGTDNGVDDLGRNLPGDELNQLVDGGDYGYPYCYGNRIDNPNVRGGDCSKTVPPAVLFPAHSAPLGMAFYTHSAFPSEYWGGVFVAQHSIQYADARAIVFVPFKEGKPSGPPQTFQSTGATWVGLAVDPYDGALFATQDRNGTIYRITYTGPAPTPVPATGVAPTAVTGKPAVRLAAQLPGASRCFQQTGKCLRGAFLNYWFRHGGLQQFGLPLTNELSEQLGDGKTYTVQYTERARLEYHPENKGTQYEVLLGRLGVELAAPRAAEQPFKPVQPCQNCGQLFFPETKHALHPQLAEYWSLNGGIPVFGYPLSEGFQERSPTDGKTYLVQYFERNRLEYHPENKGTAFEVLLGLLGVQTYQGRYGARP